MQHNTTHAPSLLDFDDVHELDGSDELVVDGHWEPCPNFWLDQPGSPICGACGWLADEHGTDAVVHQLPAPVAPARRPRRLAS